MVAISSYFATVGARVDEKSLKDVDKFLAKLEAKLSRGVGGKGLKLNVYIDEAKFDKHLRGVMQRAGKGTPLKLANVTVDPASLAKSIRETIGKAQFRAPIQAVLSRASLSTLRAQVAGALQGLPINVRVGNVSRSGGGGNRGDGSESARRRASLTGRGDPSLQEFLMGKPDKSSLSAGNRRYVDAITGKAFGGVGGNSLSGMAIQGGLGGLARMGSGSFLGRAAGMAGMALGGPMGGALGLATSGIVSLAGSAFTGIWSALGKVITLPFQAISGAASMVTGAFYRIALAAVPLVAGFGLVNKNVQQQKSRQVAMNTISKSFGSTGEAESRWLMNMSNREGMRYDTLVDPFTSFIASSAPSMGLAGAKNIFEAFTQFGLTRGADDESMKRAMVAVSQMSGKGKIGAEELRQQLGDARGFGEMQSIFAEAYQRSLGRTGTSVKTGQKAIEELGDQMKKGNVYSEKVLPYVAEIAKRMAAPGLAEARGASFAEQNRFMNQLTIGWRNFSQGGGEQGISYFWQMMQKMGQWWISNGDSLGRMFHATIIGLDAFRLSVMEVWKFLSSGEHNSITDWARSLGIDVDVIRESLLRLRDAILKLLGIDSNNVGTILETIIDRLVVFINRLAEIANGATQVVRGVDQVKQATMGKNQEYNNSSFMGKTMMLTKETLRNIADMTPFGRMINYDRPTVMGGIGGIISGTSAATTAATGAMVDLGTGSGGKPTYLPPSAQGWKPEGWGTTPADVGATRRSDFAPQQVNHNVRLEVTGNAEVIGALMDEKSKAQFPIFFSQELTKAMVQAPKQ